MPRAPDRIDLLSNNRRTAVQDLLDAAVETDGVRPASDRAVSGLHSAAVEHLLSSAANGELAGYAQLDPDGSAELAVHPDQRRRGHGRALLGALLGLNPAVRVWAHGDLPAAQALAKASGLTTVRALWQMSRPLQDTVPALPLPEGIAIRTFDPGRDGRPWVAVNAAAFADHPEQGAVTLDDLRALMTEPWFDPAGFFVAERDGRMVGFHWTKIDKPGRGEIYVLGIHPTEQGTGLGRALTVVGLNHLRDTGAREATLYVEESNTAARGLYTSLGFVRSAIDVQYATAA